MDANKYAHKLINSDESPALQKFVDDVLSELSIRESRGQHAMRVHAECEVFYCQNCKATYTIDEASGVWDATRQEIVGECPSCDAIMFSAPHEEEHEV